MIALNAALGLNAALLVDRLVGLHAASALQGRSQCCRYLCPVLSQQLTDLDGVQWQERVYKHWLNGLIFALWPDGCGGPMRKVLHVDTLIVSKICSVKRRGQHPDDSVVAADGMMPSILAGQSNRIQPRFLTMPPALSKTDAEAGELVVVPLLGLKPQPSTKNIGRLAGNRFGDLWRPMVVVLGQADKVGQQVAASGQGIDAVAAFGQKCVGPGR